MVSVWEHGTGDQVLPDARGSYCLQRGGLGSPLLLDPGWVSHAGRQLEWFSFGSFVAGLAERFTVVRYDKPGCGLSDGETADLSFDTQVDVALAVADATGADRFRLFGASQGGQLAAAIVQMLEVYYGTDVRPLLPAIRARAAVLHREGAGVDLAKAATRRRALTGYG